MVKPQIKKSLVPGNWLVAHYLEKMGLQNSESESGREISARASGPS